MWLVIGVQDFIFSLGFVILGLPYFSLANLISSFFLVIEASFVGIVPL